MRKKPSSTPAESDTPNGTNDAQTGEPADAT
jgi:hypothetical protein